MLVQHALYLALVVVSFFCLSAALFWAMMKNGPLPPVREGDAMQQVLTAERVRQGRIVLREHWQLVVFLSGLLGAVALGIVYGALS